MFNGKKLLWFDTETGGTNEKTDALIQLSAIIEIDDIVVEEINLKMRPIDGKLVNDEAIRVHGITTEMINGYQSPIAAHREFESFLSRYNELPNKTNRYIMAGYNPDFDCRFLNQWYQDITGGPYDYWKHLQFSPIDVLPVLRAMRYEGIIKIPDTKLETVCKYFGIEIKAHDAMSDIRATRELTKKVYSEFFLFAGCKITADK